MESFGLDLGQFRHEDRFKNRENDIGQEKWHQEKIVFRLGKPLVGDHQPSRQEHFYKGKNHDQTGEGIPVVA